MSERCYLELMDTKQATLPAGLTLEILDRESANHKVLCDNCGARALGDSLEDIAAATSKATDVRRLVHRRKCSTPTLQVSVSVAPEPVQVTAPAAPPAQPEHDTTGLTGSTKQIAWAARIRAAFTTAIEPALERARTDSSISYLIRDEVARLLEVELRTEAEQTSAARWIDRYRDDRPTAHGLALRVSGIAKRNEPALRELARKNKAQERLDRERGADVLAAEGGDTNPTEAERAAARMSLVRDEIDK